MTPKQRRLIRAIATVKLDRWHPDNYATLIAAMQHAARVALRQTSR